MAEGFEQTQRPGFGLYFDGRNPPPWERPWREHYPRLLDLVEECDRLGADCVWLTEHHGFEDGYLPQPLLLAAAIATRTRQARIGTAVVLASLRNPVHLAEEAAIVDLLSDGRLELGIGAGYMPAEFEMFGVDMGSRLTSVNAAYLKVQALLNKGGITPGSLQDPFRIWLGYFSKVAVRHAGRLGAPLLTINRAAVAEYMEGLVEGGHDVSSARLGGGLSVIVADDPESAYNRIAPHYLYQVNSYLVASGEQPMSNDDLGDRLGSGRMPVRVNLLVLSVDETIAELHKCTDGLPVEQLYTWATVASMPEDLVERHMQLWLGPVRDGLSDQDPRTGS